MHQYKNPAAVALGSIKSEKKADSSKANGSNWQKPHFAKCRHFESVYPHQLTNTEWQVLFATGLKTPTGRNMTYNPDYYCTKTRYFIEVATSEPNISEQGWKWGLIIQRGFPLKVFWWDGTEITERFR